MRTIYRYSLPFTERPVIEMPVGTAVLTAPPSERIAGGIEIWAEVDTLSPIERRGFRIVGTGNPMPSDCGRFIGTVIEPSGGFVWHIYEATPLDVQN